MITYKSIPLKKCVAPLYIDFKIHYLSSYRSAIKNKNSIRWLHRKKIANDYLTTEYFRNELKYVGRFKNLKIDKPDIILHPPSQHNFFLPYFLALITKFNAIDISSCFSRDDNSSTGDNTNSFEYLIPKYHYKSFGDLRNNKILIVDDAFATGKTAALIIRLLANNSQINPNQVELACPLLIDCIV